MWPAATILGPPRALYPQACAHPDALQEALAELERAAVTLKIALASLMLATSLASLALPAHAMPGVSTAVTVGTGTPNVEPVYWVWINHHRFWRHHHHWHHWHH